MKRAEAVVTRRRRRSVSVVGMGIAAAIAATTSVSVVSPAQAAVGTKSNDGSQVIAEKRLDTQTLDLTIRSKSVGQDLPVRVLLPKGWTAGNSKKYPTLTLLQGGQDNYTSWTRMTDIEQLVSNKNVMVVMPEAGPSATYTNYYNDGKYGTPGWETFHTKEVLDILENGYNASNTQRAIAGVSSGGYGASIYSAHNPGRYKYLATYSGTVSIQDPANQWIITLITGEFNFARWGAPGINQDIWAKNDPVAQAAKLKGMGIYISSGTTGLNQDGLDNTIWSPVQVVEIITGNMNIEFAAKLKSLGIPAKTHFYTYGQHSWPSWQCEMHDTLPTILTAIGANNGTAKWYPEIKACTTRS